MKIESGQKGPSFVLYDSAKNQVKLEDFKGKNVLLLFFPFAFSSVCTKELCSVRDNLAVYNHLNAQVLGISVDSLYTLARFKDEQQLDFSLLSDFNKEVSKAYGCLYEIFGYGMRGVSKRAAFLIDKEGIVRNAQVLENAKEIPDFAVIQKMLYTLI